MRNRQPRLNFGEAVRCVVAAPDEALEATIGGAPVRRLAVQSRKVGAYG
jgi:hypothetical protein